MNPKMKTMLIVLTTLMAVSPSRADQVLAQASLCSATVPDETCLQTNNAAIDGAAPAEPLTFQWRLTSSPFDLSLKSCLQSELSSTEQDIVIALDRNFSVALLDQDSGKIKNGTDSLSAAKFLVQELMVQAQDNGQTLPRVGFVSFSGPNTCQAYAGQDFVGGECLFILPKPLNDEEHARQILALLDQLAQKNPPYEGSSFAPLSDVLRNEFWQADSSAHRRKVILLTNGRPLKKTTYQTSTGQNASFSHLRIEDYESGEEDSLASFDDERWQPWRLSIGYFVNDGVYFDDNSEYQTMCGTSHATERNCNGEVLQFNPQTWPTNKYDGAGFLNKVLERRGLSHEDFYRIDNQEDLGSLLEYSQTTSNQRNLQLDSASFTVNGAAAQTASIEGNRIIMKSIPVAADTVVQLTVSGEGKSFVFPLDLALSLESSDIPTQDGAMSCQASPAAPTDGDAGPNQLQGGAASCGVLAAGKASDHSQNFLLLWLLLPLVGPWLFRRRLSIWILFCGSLLLPGTHPQARAEGFSVLHFRPVAEGIGVVEKARTTDKFQFAGGLYLDYANDLVELANAKGERLHSVVDSTATVHAVASLGIWKNLSLGLHMPFIHKSQTIRDQGDWHVRRDQIGQLADVQASIKYRFWHYRGVDFALLPTFMAPFGDQSLLISDGTPNVGLLLALSGTQGRWSWANNVGYRHRLQTVRLEDDRAEHVELQGQLVESVAASYRWNRWAIFDAYLQAQLSLADGIGLNSSSPAEFGIQYQANPWRGLHGVVGLGRGLGAGLGSPDYRVSAGVTYLPR